MCIAEILHRSSVQKGSSPYKVEVGCKDTNVTNESHRVFVHWCFHFQFVIYTTTSMLWCVIRYQLPYCITAVLILLLTTCLCKSVFDHNPDWKKIQVTFFFCAYKVGAPLSILQKGWGTTCDIAGKLISLLFNECTTVQNPWRIDYYCTCR